MRRARSSVSCGVRERSVSLKSGWKAVKCSGTSGDSSRATQRDSAVVSASLSLASGISRVVISSQVSVSWWMNCRVSSTGARCAPQNLV
ncbi:hypothetical protein D3C84_1141990 [compost metagenome]